MKITGIETVVVNAIHRNWIFVKVLTDQPACMLGRGDARMEDAGGHRRHRGSAAFVVGQDPMRIEHIANMMTRFSFWPLGSIGLTAASGIEQALWDIKGKALGVPVWQLLGGRVRDKVRVYTHLMRGAVGFQVANTDISAYCDAVQKTVEMGYDAVKLGFVPYNGYDAPIAAVRHVEKLAQAVRERVGEQVDIMVDFHGRPTRSTPRSPM